MSIKRLINISLFTTLMIIFTIIIPPIPVPIININITLQTFMVILMGLLLRPIDAFMSAFIYVLIGILGLPVFSGYKSGLGVILGPSGGFIFSFPLVAFLISMLQYKNEFYINIIVSIVCGIIVTYFIGVLWLEYYTNISLGKIIYGMLIFIPFDLLKCVLASIVSVKLKDVLKDNIIYLNKKGYKL